jgi:predicted amidohydrolase
MARYVKVAAAQMGPISEGASREGVVARMLALLDQAVEERVELLVYPELALTPYFPKRIREDYDQFFESAMPSAATEPLFDKAREHRMAFHLGYAEKDGGRYYNTAILVDEDGAVIGKFRKIHLPGLAHADPDGNARVFEPRYFATGDAGFQVFAAKRAQVGVAICQDRRYPESYRSLGLQGAEIIVIGYNTPTYPLALAHNELVMRAGAYANSLFVVGCAKAGVEDGMELIGGSCVIDPLGEIVAKAATTGDELVAARIDLDQTTRARKRWNFFGRRHPEHYGLLTEPVRRAAP